MDTLRKSPFPGMDPYLEAPDIWPDFHHALASELRALLNAVLPPPFYSRVEMRPEVGIIWDENMGGQRRIVPDVVVVESPREPLRVREVQAPYFAVAEPRTEITPGVKLRLADEPLRHAFVEIRDTARGHKLITLIEIVSPSNKRPGPDRRAYLSKQREVLESDANLVEIDLLRGGERLFSHPELAATAERLGPDYLIVVDRSAQRGGPALEFSLYPVKGREMLPCIGVPLTGEWPDVPLDLQVAVQRAYAGGPYFRLLDYTAPPDPPLDEDDAAWADELLRAAGRRATQ